MAGEATGPVREYIWSRLTESIEPQLVEIQGDVAQNAQDIQVLDQRTIELQQRLATLGPALSSEQIIDLVQRSGFVTSDELDRQHAEFAALIAQDQQDIAALVTETQRLDTSLAGVSRQSAIVMSVTTQKFQVIEPKIADLEARVPTEQELADIAATLDAVRGLPATVDDHAVRITDLEARPDQVRTDADILGVVAGAGYLTNQQIRPSFLQIQDTLASVNQKTIDNRGRIEALEARPDQVRTDAEIAGVVATLGYAPLANLEALAARVEANRTASANNATNLKALDMDVDAYVLDLRTRMDTLEADIPTAEELDAAIDARIDATFPVDFPRTPVELQSKLEAYIPPDFPRTREDLQNSIETAFGTIATRGSGFNLALRDAIGLETYVPFSRLEAAMEGMKNVYTGLQNQFRRMKVEFDVWRQELKQTIDQETDVPFKPDVSLGTLMRHLFSADDSPTRVFMRGGTSRMGGVYMGLVPLLDGTLAVFGDAFRNFEAAELNFGSLATSFPG